MHTGENGITDHEMHFRALLVKLQDRLSDSDRCRLHFLFRHIIPEGIGDDPSINGTLNLLESLFDCGKISDQDFDYLIEAFREIGCYNIVKRLEAHAQDLRREKDTVQLSLLQHMLDNIEEDKIHSINCQAQQVQLEPNTITSRTRPLPSSSKSLGKIKKRDGVGSRLFMFDSKHIFRTWIRCPLILVVILGLFNIVGITIIIFQFVVIRDLQAKLKAHVSTDKALSLSARHDDGICATATWVQNATTVAGGHGLGSRLNQLNSPFGFFVDDNQTIYLIDSYNNRIVKWDRGALNGEVVAGEKGYGSQNDQLSYPHDIFVDKDGTMYISDTDNRRVQRWSRGAQSGQTIIRNISARGIAQDDQGSLYVVDWENGELKKWRVGEKIGQVITSELNHPYFLFVNRNRSVYVADANNHRVIKVDDGTTKISIVAGGSYGNGTNQLAFPRGVAVDQLGTVYVADTENHRIMRWPYRAMSGSIIAGGYGAGSPSNQLHGPNDLSFDQDGNLYVVDHYNHRVQRFAIDKSLC